MGRTIQYLIQLIIIFCKNKPQKYEFIATITEGPRESVLYQFARMLQGAQGSTAYMGIGGGTFVPEPATRDYYIMVQPDANTRPIKAHVELRDDQLQTYSMGTKIKIQTTKWKFFWATEHEVVPSSQ